MWNYSQLSHWDVGRKNVELLTALPTGSRQEECGTTHNSPTGSRQEERGTTHGSPHWE